MNWTPGDDHGDRTSLIERVRTYLRNDDWHFDHHPENNFLTMGFKGQHGTFRVVVRTREEEEQVAVYSLHGTAIPEEHRAEVAEFSTRANYNMILGNFEMDFRDGEFRYKTSIDVEGGELTETMFRNLLTSNVLMIDRYTPGLMRVLYSGISAEEAVQEIEETPSEDGGL